MNFKLLKNKDFTLLILGKFVSLIGSVMQSFALSLYVLKITGSGSAFASVMAIGLLPRLVLGPICGVFADWFDRKKIIVYLDLLSGFLVLGLYAVSLTVGIQLIHVYITVIVLSIISSLFNPAISSAIPSIMKKEELLDANSFNSLVMTFGNLLGPILAGIVYGIFGLPFTLLLNGISFICSAISEMFIDLPKNSIKTSEMTYSKFRADFSGGIKFIKSKSLLYKFLICSFVINFAFNPIFSVGLLYISKMVLKVGDIQFGMLQTALVAGSLIGTLIVGKFSKKFDLVKIFCFGVLFCGLLVGLISFNSSEIYLSLFSLNIIPFITLTIIGMIIIAGTSVINITMLTINQKEIPNEYFGRVSSVWSTTSMGAIPIGQIFFGFLYDKLLNYLPALFTSVILVVTAVSLLISLQKGQKNTTINTDYEAANAIQS